MELISLLADVGVLLPPLAVAIFMLLARREIRPALCWAAAATLTIGATGLLKQGLSGVEGFAHFPSGHVSLAVAFWGGLLTLLAGGGNRLGALALCAAVALVEGWSRVELTSHTWIDVLGGFAVGALALLLFGAPGALRTGARTRAWVVLAMMVAAPAGYLTYPWLGYSLRTMAQ
jgi:membrane-associated phospholipid phosphatase